MRGVRTGVLKELVVGAFDESLAELCLVPGPPAAGVFDEPGDCAGVEVVAEQNESVFEIGQSTGCLARLAPVPHVAVQRSTSSHVRVVLPIARRCWTVRGLTGGSCLSASPPHRSCYTVRKFPGVTQRVGDLPGRDIEPAFCRTSARPRATRELPAFSATR
jgi:hypothetical protein